MSAMALLKRATTLLFGRWQVPLAIVAAATAAIALYRITPPGQSLDFAAIMVDVRALEAAGQFVDATDAAGNLLAMEPPLPPKQRQALHEYLSDLLFRQEQARERSGALVVQENVRQALAQLAAAEALGRPHDADAALRAGRAHEWLDEHVKAQREFRNTLNLDPPAEPRRQALQGLVRLLEGRPGARAERRRYLEDLLADDGVSPNYLWWALQRALLDALDQNDTGRARQLLDRHARRLKSSDLTGYYDYLYAWIMVHEGRHEEAEPWVHRIDVWLDHSAGARSRLDGYGHLPAMNRWLLGEIHLAARRPQEALAAFDEALRLEPDGVIFLPATVGRGRALSDLERHETARAVFRTAAQKLAQDRSRRARAIERFGRTLINLYEARNALKDYANAVGYLALAAELTPPDDEVRRLELLDRLGRLQDEAARSDTDADARRVLFADAGRSFERAARLSSRDGSREATLLWSAAQGYDRAGMIGDVRRMLRQFVRGRAADPRMPQALLQLGQAYEVDGNLPEAVTWYGRVIEKFPRLKEAARAKVLLAGSLLGLGEGRQDEAEDILSALLEDDFIRPEAEEFRDALFTLCDLYYSQGRYAVAIGRLEDFLTLYPDDRERDLSRFMLADAHRRSAYELRGRPPAGTSASQVRKVIRARFARAAELFALYLAGVMGRAENDPVLKTYQRLALFHRGDCLLELNEPQSLREALETYRQAAARYEGAPSALTAQVQIANILLRNGRLTEAARAVERARWLLRNISDEVFKEYDDGTNRAYWDRYLTAVASSHLFRDVFASPR